MPKLVNLGSLCIDHVYTVSHVTTAGETLASKSHEVFPGGKGLNQSLAAARAGAEVHHVGCVGTDGSWLCDVLKESGVNVDGVRVASDASGHAVIQVNDAGENAIVIAGGTNRTLTATDRQRAFSLLAGGDWLLLQNEINDVERVLAEAKSRQVNVAFNVAPVDGRETGYDYSMVGLLIVNEVEAAALAQEEDPERAAKVLQERYPEAYVLLTLGREGGFCISPSGEIEQYQSYKVNAVDETAAGDTFIGFFMASWLAGQSMGEALANANAAGALAVTVAGAASSVPTKAEVDSFRKR